MPHPQPLTIKDLGALVLVAASPRRPRLHIPDRAQFWAACRAVEQGEDPDVLVGTALELGLEPREVEATIRSARRGQV